jgi:molybdopterin synthase sulfur carrier subunit
MPTISLPSVLTPFADGHPVLTATGETVGQALDDVSRRYPTLAPRLREPGGAPHPFVTIYLNDEDIRFLQGFETAVRPADEVSVVPAVAGG